MMILLNILVFLAAFGFMEFFAWFAHKYIMHGVGWFLHKSHHEPHEGFFELNDVYVLLFALPAIILMYIGSSDWGLLFWCGAGVSAYGMSYFIFHDVIVHRRVTHGYRPHSRYMKRLVRAHKIHHKNLGKENGTSFGFLVASSKYDVVREGGE